jgi:Protein of unknown function (DUF4241)
MTKYNIPQHLESAFQSNFSFTDTGANRYDFYVFELGDLKVAEGNIVAVDPLMYTNDLPFTASFPTGKFPVQLAVAKIKDDERVGFARIKFSAELPVRWTMAVIDGQNPDELGADQIFGYGVDAGLGAFMDISGGRELMSFIDAEPGNDEVIIEELEKTTKDTWSSLMWEHNASNVAIFSSGWGDGFYASYIGYDNDDNICRLVTDFGVIE